MKLGLGTHRRGGAYYVAETERRSWTAFLNAVAFMKAAKRT